MPKSVLQFNPAGTLTPEDVLYLIQGTGLDRDRKVTLEAVRAWMNGLTTVAITLAGDDTVDYTLAGNGNSLLVLSGVSATQYTLTLSGTPPIPGQKTTIANMSAGTVALAGALFVPGTVRILPGETAQLEWNSDISAVVQVGSTEASVVGRFVATVLERDTYVSDTAEIGPTGSVPLIRGGVLYEASTEDLRGQGYQIPQSGAYAMKLNDSSSQGSSLDGGGYTRGIIKYESVRSVSNAKRWSLTWNGEFGNSQIVSDSRVMSLSIAFPTTPATTQDKLATSFFSSFTDTWTAVPVSVCLSRVNVPPGYSRVLPAYARREETAGLYLLFVVLNPDGTPFTYAQLKTFLGGGDPDLTIRISAEGNS